MSKVYYNHLIEGMTVPAIIHNMHYYYISMPVFEDGTIDCWERLPLHGLENKLLSQKLVTTIPTGKEIRIYGLGSYTIVNANWLHTPESYSTYVHNCVKKMNREMVGLFEETAEQKEKWEKYRVKWSTHAKPYKQKGNYGYKMIDGVSVSLFYKSNHGWELTSITAYEDGSLFLDNTSNSLSFEDIENMFSSDVLSSSIEGEFILSIPNFAVLTLTGNHQTNSVEKQKEIEDMIAKA